MNYQKKTISGLTILSFLTVIAEIIAFCLLYLEVISAYDYLPIGIAFILLSIAGIVLGMLGNKHSRNLYSIIAIGTCVATFFLSLYFCYYIWVQTNF
jgi:hypothetical protein